MSGSPSDGIPSILIIITDLLNKYNKIAPVYAKHIVHLDQVFSLTVVFACVVQFKFEGVLFRSDSRHNDRVDSLCECPPPSGPK